MPATRMQFCGYSKCSAVYLLYLWPDPFSIDSGCCIQRLWPVDRNGAISSLYPILCRDARACTIICENVFSTTIKTLIRKQGHLQFTKMFYIYFSNMISCKQHLTQYTIVQYACIYFPSLSASLSFTFFSFEDKAK